MDKNLIAYIAERNNLVSFMEKFGGTGMKRYDANHITPAEKTELLDDLEGALSPENLSCDGELRGAKLVKKSKMLNGAKAALEAM